MTTGTARFTALQRLLHWSLALAILAMLFIGVGMVSTVMPRYVPLLVAHKTLGIVVLVLALLRLAVRLRSGAPSLPPDLPAPMRASANLSHLALYALMIAMPHIGWGILSAGGYPIVLDGDIRRRSCRPTTRCMRCSGARTSPWRSSSSPSCWPLWAPRCFTA
jgi:cytochrome b561